jgi:cell wall-associated NlpC family hydrolase
MHFKFIRPLLVLTLLFGTAAKAKTASRHATKTSHHKAVRTAHHEESGSGMINTGDTSPEDLLDFARTNIGIPYLFGSTNPEKGFDCSGFVTYVFNHFGIKVPRGSADYSSVQHQVKLEDARPGDLILFTGTNKRIRRIGHMGIIVKGFTDALEFIHSSSGDAHGVTITPLNARYMARLIKIIRVFPQQITEYSAD